MKSFIRAEKLVLDYPILGYRGDSLKSTIINNTIGGIIKTQERTNKVTNVRALENISFEVSDGDKLGLIGSNGAGKSSLLRVISGAYPITSGNLKIKGRISSMLNLQCGIDPELTGIENIEFRLKLAGINGKTYRKTFDDIIEFSDLNDFIKLPMRVYSSGMMTRLIFGIATAIPADIILMDEWLSVGDKNFNEKASNRLNKFVKNSSLLVLASHNLNFVNSLCNKILTMDMGKMINFEKLKPKRT